MSRLGRIDEYDPKVQNFDSYLERFEHFVSANEVSEAKKLSVFLTVLGAEAYEALKNLVVPALPGEKTFAEIKILLKNHYSPQTSVIAERCRFNRRVQLEQESVEDFVLELKHLARKCNFGDFLQDALRDRLVAGIRNEETQRALFTTEGLTFQGACKIALDRELATQQAALLQQRGRSEALNAVGTHERCDRKTKDSTRGKSQKQKCSRCGKAHTSDSCWYKRYKCRRCSKVGHLQNMCQASREELKAHLVSESSEEESTLYSCDATPSKKSYVVSVNVEGHDLPIQVDTGAAVTVVPESVYAAKLSHVKSSLSQQAPLPSEQPRESPGSAGPTVETTCPEETSSAGTNAPASPPSPAADSTVPLDASGDSRESSLPANDDAVVPPRRSQRKRRPPDWFRPSDFKK
ncbi:uncharacterized protein LOC144108219 [Amblyomma americanum]